MKDKAPANWIKQVGPFHLSDKGGVAVEMIQSSPTGQEDKAVKTYFRDYKVLEFILDNQLACREFLVSAKEQAEKHDEVKVQTKLVRKLERAGITIEELAALMGKR